VDNACSEAPGDNEAIDKTSTALESHHRKGCEHAGPELSVIEGPLQHDLVGSVEDNQSPAIVLTLAALTKVIEIEFSTRA